VPLSTFDPLASWSLWMPHLGYNYDSGISNMLSSLFRLFSPTFGYVQQNQLRALCSKPSTPEKLSKDIYLILKVWPLVPCILHCFMPFHIKNRTLHNVLVLCNYYLIFPVSKDNCVREGNWICSWRCCYLWNHC
jgi:hypothetical protein